MKSIVELLKNNTNQKIKIKKILIDDQELRNKLFEIGIRENSIINIEINLKNNKNIIVIESRGNYYAFRKNDIEGIYGIEQK